MSENQNRPRGRKRNITGQAQEIKKQEQVSGSGPVGNAQSYADRPVQRPAGQQNVQQPVNRPMPQRPAGQQSAQQPLNQQASQRPMGQQNMQQPVNPQGFSRPSGSQSSAPWPPASQGAQRPSASQSAAKRPVIHQRPRQESAASSGSGTTRAGQSKSGCMPLIILLVVVLLGGGAGLSNLFGGGLFGGGSGSLTGDSSTPYSSSSSSGQDAASLLQGLLSGGESGSSGTSSSGSTSGSWGSSSGSSSGSTSLGDLFGQTSGGSSLGDLFGQTSGGSSSGGSSLGNLLGQTSGGSGSVVQSLLGSGSWYSMFGGADSSVSMSGVRTDSTSLNTRVAAGSRDKFTVLKGGGKDKVTILVYMCGADLESRSGMATRDLQEMVAASLGSRVNLIIYTGGASRWQNNAVSSRVNQIWQVKNGKLVCLEENMGTSAMTSPQTLVSFLDYGAKNFKADRNMLIFWDHGSGSVTGYGYDEKNQRAGSMSLAGINSALKSTGLRFDFIGFDACLMATVENALMLSEYADYLIASEETEPGIGWYYTNWLNQLGKNTSVSTLELGKTICDDFTAACKKSCPGQTTTLSVVDLAELAHTVPEQLTAFSLSLTDLIKGSDYRTVSDARNGSREFATSSRTDMVDLTDLALKLGNTQGNALADALKSAVKYNRSTTTNAYGLSIFFPYQKVSSVDKAVSTYEAIGLDDSYADAIRAFASVEAGGQAVSSHGGYQIPSILTGTGSYSSGAYGSSDMISSLLSGFLGGSDMGFLSGRIAEVDAMTEYYAANMIDPSELVIRDGKLILSPEKWALIHSVVLNLFYDDGSGYIDLGLDPVFSWDESGNLVADASGAWLALNGQIAPYYSTGTEDDGETWKTTGYIPVLLNGWQAELLVTFDEAHEGGYISGARWIYKEGETEAVAKALAELAPGDQIQLVCDYYDYDGTYQSSHILGNPIVIPEDGELELTDLLLPDASKAVFTYRLTDIYNQTYWTAPF